MLRKFRQFIEDHQLMNNSDRLLLAVSGGIDSVVLTHLIHRCGYQFAIAHCNFKLRGKDADADAAFTKQLAISINVPYHEKTFETKKYAQAQGISLQMAARELRFNWFDTLMKDEDYDYLALAHNKNDLTETLLINLIRGTGISGLHGILPKNKLNIRPLLFAERAEIETYAKKNNIAFRTDKSNFEDKYIRNNIRLNIIPLLKKINPSIIESLNTTAQNLYHVEQVFKDKVKEVGAQIISKKEERIFIDKLFFLNQLNAAAYLYAFINDYGFNASQVSQIKSAIEKTSGKIFLSATHRLLVDRSYLIIEPITGITSEEVLFLESNTKSVSMQDLNLSISIVSPDEIEALNKTGKKLCYLDYEKLEFPLTLRTWQQKDKFVPLGMKQKKKLSDFLIDDKIHLFDKEKVKVLISNKNICWVIGHRIDDRYKIQASTRKVLKIEIL